MVIVNDVPQLVYKKEGSYAAISPNLEPGKFNKWKKRMICYLAGMEPYYLKCTKDGHFSQKQLEDEEEVFDEEEVTQVIVLMALADDEITIGKNHARNGEWVDITVRKGASPSSEVMPLTLQPHSPKERPCLGIMKHTKPEAQDSSNKNVSGTVTIRGGVLAESSQSNESLIGVKCNTCRSTIHSPLNTVSLITSKERHIREPIWYLDSGCSRSMTGVKSYLHKYVEQPGPKVVFGDNSSCITEGYGSINCGGIVFTKVAFVNGLKYNLISISQLCDAKYIVQFDDKQGTIFNANKEIVLIAPRRNDVYVLDMSSLTPNGACFFAKASESVNWLWHKRLSHLNFKNINKLAKQNKVLGLPSLVYSKDKPCTTCEKGKHHRASFKTKQNFSIRKCLHLLHMDLFGPVSPMSINHEKYTLVIVDEYSRIFLCLKGFQSLNTRRQQIEGTYHVTFDESMKAIRFTNTSVDEIGIDDSSRYPPDEFLKDDPSRQYQVDSDVSYYIVPHQCSLTEITQENHVPEVIAPNEPKIPHTKDTKGRCSRDQHIELINIIGNPGEGMLTRSMAAKLTATSASECLFADFLSNIEPKKFTKWMSKEEVYVKQPPGFESSEFPNYVCKLDKALYGLKQAPRAWYDIIFDSTSYKLCKQFEKLMTEKFEMSMMGELTYFLGFQIKQDDKGILLCQEQYTRNLLKNLVLCARYQSNPKESRLTAVKRILKYLKGTPTLGLYYLKCSGFDLKRYSDSDYIGCNMDRKSTSGACQILSGKLVCWSAKKQQSVAMSSTEAEYVAAVGCCVSILWMKSQLSDYDIHYKMVPIFCDNTIAIAISNNLILYSRTKHIDIRYHLIRDHILKGDIELHFIPTEYQLADIFTKPLDE
ncbi:retrovirus-related pol polyprotein from transposon TNT 1-94 [Tanacetum coccineum]